ncbi:NUDIX hydrolase [Streptococcus constellatus]|uniref:NUDIX hydrolase n=1 Tax=Streptococcus constellatus TaxID=76860 RepID=UPI00123BBFCB|nr:NUDIX hydrolase [Streptococcus constellatus]
MSDMTVLYQTFDFSGCKIALLYGDTILTILRDDIPAIPYPNMWDFPGGGREKGETPFECIKREVFEELGITIKESSILWVKVYQGIVNPDTTSVFIVGVISQKEIDQIVFGNEGQGYKLVNIEELLADENVIPQLKSRLRDYLEEVQR